MRSHLTQFTAGLFARSLNCCTGLGTKQREQVRSRSLPPFLHACLSLLWTERGTG